MTQHTIKTFGHTICEDCVEQQDAVSDEDTQAQAIAQMGGEQKQLQRQVGDRLENAF